MEERALRIRAAAVAGWWTLLIATVLLVVMWLAYLFVSSAQPDFVLTLWGGGADWDQVRKAWFWFLAAYKVLLFLVALVLVWMTLWARELRRTP